MIGKRYVCNNHRRNENPSLENKKYGTSRSAQDVGMYLFNTKNRSMLSCTCVLPAHPHALHGGVHEGSCVGCYPISSLSDKGAWEHWRGGLRKRSGRWTDGLET